MWLYNGNELSPEEVSSNVGMVYLIEGDDGRKYIGKKLFHFSRRKKVKGKTKRSVVPSDFQTYYGSNDDLKKDVAARGEEKFKRTVLRLCKSKSEMNYWEAKYQFENDVLLSDEWYNSWIMVKVRKCRILKGEQ